MKTFVKLFLLLAFAVYLVTAFYRMADSKDETICNQLRVIIVDSLYAGFIDQAEVERILREKRLHPLGLPMDTIQGKRIEDELSANPYVKLAVCYKTNGGVLNILIMQHLPIMRILSDKGENYYIDEMGDPFLPNGYLSNLVVATGNIDSAFAKNHLREMGLYLRDHDFWDRQVTQIYIDENQQAHLTMRVGSQLPVKFGEVDSIARKFRNLKAFYEQVIPEVGWNEYKEIDLTFHNQIVCKKNSSKNKIKEFKKLHQQKN